MTEGRTFASTNSRNEIINFAKPSIAAVALAVAPGASFAFNSASQSGIPICSKPSIALSPIPLLGVLIIRRKEISS